MLYICHFFCNDTASTEIYTLSLHDALPIFDQIQAELDGKVAKSGMALLPESAQHPERMNEFNHRAVASRTSDDEDRKSTRLNSSHANISYAVFCLKKKNK